LKGVIAVLRYVVALSEQNTTQAFYFQNSLFRIEQLTMLFAAHELLYWFHIIHFYIIKIIRGIATQLFSDFASILVTRHLDRKHSTDTVVQLIVSIDFISVCTYG